MQILEKERLGALTVFVFCLGAWSMLDGMPEEAAFFPRLIVGLAFVLSIWWGVSSIIMQRAQVPAGQDGSAGFLENPRNFFVFLLCLVAYIALIDTIGYFSASAMFILLTSLLLGYRHPLAVVLTAIGFITFIYVIFVVIFKRPLPVEFFQPK